MEGDPDAQNESARRSHIGGINFNFDGLGFPVLMRRPSSDPTPFPVRP